MRLGSALLVFVLFLFVCAQVVSCTQARADVRLHSTAYDGHMQRAAYRWLPEYDWRWLKAQCWQESRFDARAVSPAGARGFCQFMPGTWAEAQRAIGVRSVWSVRDNTLAAGWYMRRMLNIWIWDRTTAQRLELAQASYNAGAGNILRAQRLCGKPKTWAEIRECLPQVTGRHAAETIGYVKNIARWHGELVCGQS